MTPANAFTETSPASSSALQSGQPLRISLATGTLTLAVQSGSGDSGAELASLCEFGARANPRRGFLIVSKVLGRHLPARPSAMRGAMARLAGFLPDDLPTPIIFLGMAETATALGQGIFAAYQQMHPDQFCLYLQTARQTVAGAEVLASFEEGHSHATSHKVQVADRELLALAREARSLIIIDDESSTGNTFVAAAEAMLAALPQLERIDTCCLTDWSCGLYLTRLPCEAKRHYLLTGTMTWQAGVAALPPLAATSNGVGDAPPLGMRSRSGLLSPEAAARLPVTCGHGERVLVLGDGEHAYEALLIAEEIETQGGIAAVQSITRTPALEGHAMRTRSTYEDAYGSGAPAFLYNILAHQPHRILIAAEIAGKQVDDTRRALQDLGAEASDIKIELVNCIYPGENAC